MFRSSSVGKEIAVQATLVIITLFVVVYALVSGFMLEGVLVKTLKLPDPVGFLNRVLLYYFIGELVMRYFMQSMPAWDVQSYLHLPIPRRHIVHFLLSRSLLHVINASVFLFFAPFAMSAVADAYGLGHAWGWLLGLWFLSLMNHFMLMFLKKVLAHKAWGLLLFIAAASFMATSDYFGWVRLSAASEAFFGTMLHGYSTTAWLFLGVVLFYFLLYKYYIDRMYPEELGSDDKQIFRNADLAFLRKFGLIGIWIDVELKLIFRNRRSRELFFMNGMFFFVVLILSYVQRTAGDIFFLFFGIISSGFFTANYGQFLFSWQGKHFDFSITQPTSIQVFVESKYWLLTAITVLWFLFSIPLVFLGWHFLLVNFVCVLFNIGVSTFIIMNMSMWGANSIDLTHKGTLNYEGIGAAQWVMGIPFMFAPFVIFLPFFFLGYPFLGIIAVGLAGLAGIVFHRKLLEITAKRHSNLRYTMAANFRKD